MRCNHNIYFERFLRGLRALKCSATLSVKLDFCLTVHHQLGKIIQMNQLDATMIY